MAVFFRAARIPYASICLLLMLLILASGAAGANESPGLRFNLQPVQETVSDSRLKNALSYLEKTAQELIDKKAVPGLSLAVVYKDKLVLARGYGVRVNGNPEKVDADTVFQLASVSKPLAATVISSLVAEGKISWDSKITELDPDFEMYDPWVTRELTIRDLFAHRSGLPDHAGDLLEDMGYGRDEVLRRLRYQKPHSSMRSAYAYTNFGLTEAAVAAAKSCDKDWESLSDEKLYKPLGMNSSSSRYSDFMARENKALGHVLLDSKWVHKTQRQPDAQSPAGGASSSANDMAQWLRLQLAGGRLGGKQVISAAALSTAHQPHMFLRLSPINQLPLFYGLGFNVSYDAEGRLRLGHSGAFSLGASTTLTLLPGEELGICVLTNAAPSGVPEGLANAFVDMALYGKTSQDWFALYKQIIASEFEMENKYNTAPASARPASGNASYIGRYQNELFGPLEVSKKDGNLFMSLGPKPKRFALKHFDADTFVYTAEEEELSGASALKFNLDAGGKAVSVLIENLDYEGQGLFKRESDRH